MDMTPGPDETSWLRFVMRPDCHDDAIHIRIGKLWIHGEREHATGHALGTVERGSAKRSVSRMKMIRDRIMNSRQNALRLAPCHQRGAVVHRDDEQVIHMLEFRWMFGQIHRKVVETGVISAGNVAAAVRCAGAFPRHSTWRGRRQTISAAR